MHSEESAPDGPVARPPLVLVVCAHEAMGRRLVSLVEGAGLRALHAADGERALFVCGEHVLDAVVIALQLPGMGAGDLTRELRRRGRTAIVVASSGGERGRIEALEAGADDHVEVPFDDREVTARIRALLRRTAGSLAVARTVRLGPVAVRVRRGVGAIDGSPAALAPEEATLLGVLVERAGCVVSRGALADRLVAAHGREAVDTLEDHLGQLAARLSSAGAPGLRTVTGPGYVLDRAPGEGGSTGPSGQEPGA